MADDSDDDLGRMRYGQVPPSAAACHAKVSTRKSPKACQATPAARLVVEDPGVGLVRGGGHERVHCLAVGMQLPVGAAAGELAAECRDVLSSRSATCRPERGDSAAGGWTSASPRRASHHLPVPAWGCSEVVAKHDVDSPLTRYRIPVRPSRVGTTTGAVTDHQPRRQQVLLRGPFGSSIRWSTHCAARDPMRELSGLTEVSDTWRIAETKVSS